MCYAIPGKVVELKGRIAVVDYFGEQRNVSNEFVDVRIGDYVYAQGGIVIERISEKDAIPILREWRNRFFQLKRLDLKISRISRRGRADNEFEKLLRKVEEGESFKKEEMVRLLETDGEELKLLLKTANGIRQKYLKNSCCVHGILEFSNYCRNNCLYCGLRRDNGRLKRYRMGIDEIAEVVDDVVKRFGFRAIVLQSGEDPWYTTGRLVEMVRGIRKRCGILLFMSIGERSFGCYKKLYEAGARGVLLRFETSNPRLYGKIHSGPKSDFRKRIKLLKYAKRLGYIIATGSLIGLADQREEDLVNDILLTKSLNADMYSFGPLIPHPDTPLSNSEVVDINRVLKVIAVSRLVEPNAKILVTTALETLDKENGGRRALLAGANSLMINVTPEEFKNLYSLYPDRAGSNREVEENIRDTLKLLYSLGRAPTDLGM